MRDVLLDRGPVFWLHEPVYLWLTSAAALVTFLVAPHIQRRASAAVVGRCGGPRRVQRDGRADALDAGAGPAVAVLMGTHDRHLRRPDPRRGLHRDPADPEREVYATAAAAGATALVVGRGARARPRRPSAAAGLALAFAIRAVGLVFGLSLPVYRPREARPR